MKSFLPSTPKKPISACLNCLSDYTPLHPNQKYCSDDCANSVRKQSNKGNMRVKRQVTPRAPTPYSTPDFCSLDGEAIKHGRFERCYTNSDGELITENVTSSHYVMLQSDAAPPLLAPCLTNPDAKIASLSTLTIFDWLFGSYFSNKTIIGYYLNYDFENILRDVPDDLYLKLLEAEEIVWGGYKIWLIPKKILKISRVWQEGGKEKKVERSIYDYSGYWQRAFLKTVADNKDCCTPDEWKILVEGKAARNTFAIEDWESIAAYNQVECQVLTKIAKKSFNAISEGFIHAGINVIPRGKHAYSPKALAVQFFKSIDWTSKHPLLKLNAVDKAKFAKTLIPDSDSEAAYDMAGDNLTLEFPFSAAYYGGRIESMQMGEFLNVHAYDIRSAYPKGLSAMPTFTADALRYYDEPVKIAESIDYRLAGMYLIDWRLPDSWSAYPFPYRSQKGNVFYPAQGSGWVSSLELYAALDTLNLKEIAKITIRAACVINNTFGQGCVSYESRLDEWENAYNARQELKNKGISGEYGIKLLLNSAYGATIQQVGVKHWDNPDDLKLFNDFVGMFITAYCRATVWLEIAAIRRDKKALIGIQTDGIYLTVPLPKINTEARLGCWEYDQLDKMENIMSGIYRYTQGKKTTVKQRGWGSKFDFDRAYNALKTGDEYSIVGDCFVPRSFALHQKNVLKDCALQWIPLTKDFVPSLAAKRISKPREKLGNAQNKYYQAKIATAFLMQAEHIAKPFKLKFKNTNHADNATNIEFLSEHLEGNENFYAGIEE